MMEDDEIVSGYVRHVDRVPVFPPSASREELPSVLTVDQSAENDDCFWAWEAVTELIGSDPERAWRLLLSALARCAPGHEHIIGAGPLEELLGLHPRRFAARAADEVVHNSRFRDAFQVIRFSTEFTTVEDANFFTDTFRSSGVPSELLPEWRVAESDES